MRLAFIIVKTHIFFQNSFKVMNSLHTLLIAYKDMKFACLAKNASFVSRTWQLFVQFFCKWRDSNIMQYLLDKILGRLCYSFILD